MSTPTEETPHVWKADDGVPRITNPQPGVVYHFYMGTETFAFCPGEQCDGEPSDGSWCHVQLVQAVVDENG